jgi:hypothetical protein
MPSCRLTLLLSSATEVKITRIFGKSLPYRMKTVFSLFSPNQAGFPVGLCAAFRGARLFHFYRPF